MDREASPGWEDTSNYNPQACTPRLEDPPCYLYQRNIQQAAVLNHAVRDKFGDEENFFQRKKSAPIDIKKEPEWVLKQKRAELLNVWNTSTRKTNDQKTQSLQATSGIYCKTYNISPEKLYHQTLIDPLDSPSKDRDTDSSESSDDISFEDIFVNVEVLSGKTSHNNQGVNSDDQQQTTIRQIKRSEPINIPRVSEHKHMVPFPSFFRK